MAKELTPEMKSGLDSFVSDRGLATKWDGMKFIALFLFVVLKEGKIFFDVLQVPKASDDTKLTTIMQMQAVNAANAKQAIEPYGSTKDDGSYTVDERLVKLLKKATSYEEVKDSEGNTRLVVAFGKTAWDAENIKGSPISAEKLKVALKVLGLELLEEGQPDDTTKKEKAEKAE